MTLLRRSCVVPTHIQYVPCMIPTFLRKAPLCLFRKQLHLQHSSDLPARPRGAHPKTMKGRRLLCWYWRILLILSINLTTRYYILYQVHSSNQDLIMRQGRGSEATETVFCLQAEKPLHNLSYEHRVPKIKKKQDIILYQGCLCDSRS